MSMSMAPSPCACMAMGEGAWPAKGRETAGPRGCTVAAAAGALPWAETAPGGAPPPDDRLAKWAGGGDWVARCCMRAMCCAE